jgi:trans-2,3-dihydro-3-hydroxyanthranilate isomerase
MRFVTVDVFTDQPFRGNPLAVVVDGDGLTTEQMQAIAAEFGYSETTFVCTPTGPGFDAAVRIFTPKVELGFAGHPNVGTALVLAEGDRQLRFEQGAGAVEITVRDGEAEVAAPQLFAVRGAVDVQDVADACGLDVSDIVGEPVLASCGTPFVVARTSSLRAARPVRQVGAAEAVGVMLYEPGDPIRCRMFAPAVGGPPEDPATGSAALVLAGLLAQQSGPGTWTLEQGVEMGRPSRMRVRADGAGRTWLAGVAVEMMRGTLSLGG